MLPRRFFLPLAHQIHVASHAGAPALSQHTQGGLPLMGAAITASTTTIFSPLPPPPRKSQIQTFPLRNPTKPKINNKTQQQQSKKKTKQNKEKVSIELSFTQKHLSGKKKVGREAGWGQLVILGKESEELNKCLSRERVGKVPASSQSHKKKKKKILEKYLKICTFIS